MGSPRGSRWRIAALAVCAAALSACDSAAVRWLLDLRAQLLGGASPPALEALPAPPAPPAPPAASAAPAPRPPADDAPRLELSGQRRFAGGRPLPWWSERLSRLRRDGPEELYRLTLVRARAAGLEVMEHPGGEVAVTATPREAQR